MSMTNVKRYMYAIWKIPLTPTKIIYIVEKAYTFNYYYTFFYFIFTSLFALTGCGFRILISTLNVTPQ